jgi:hypothetical protein
LIRAKPSAAKGQYVKAIALQHDGTGREGRADADKRRRRRSALKASER